jgi:hypothetical protein
VTAAKPAEMRASFADLPLIGVTVDVAGRVHTAGTYNVATFSADIDAGAKLADAVSDEQTLGLEIQMSPIRRDHRQCRRRWTMLR